MRPMAKRASSSIQIKDLDTAIKQTLTVYHQEVNEAIDATSEAAVKALVKKTKATAPVNRGDFKRSIASKLLKKNRNGSTYVWYVKAPNYRLTHLLVKGHDTRDGDRTKADPFLKNALDEVLPEYQKNVEEALKNGK